MDSNRVYQMFIVNFIVDNHAILSNCTSWEVLSIKVVVSKSAFGKLATPINIKSSIEIVVILPVMTFIIIFAITLTTKLILVASAPTTSSNSMTIEIISKSHGRTTVVVVARTPLVTTTSSIFGGWQLKCLALLNSNRLSK